MYRTVTAALLVAVTLLGAACAQQTTATTTVTTAPSVTTTTIASTTTTAAPAVVLTLSDQTVQDLHVTVDEVDASVPVSLSVSDSNGLAGQTGLLEPGAYQQVVVALDRKAWEPDVLTSDVPVLLTVAAVNEDGDTLASTQVTVTLSIPKTDYTVPAPPDDSQSGGLTVDQEQTLVQKEGLAITERYVQTFQSYFLNSYNVTDETMSIPGDLPVEGAARSFLQIAADRVRISYDCSTTGATPWCKYMGSLPEGSFDAWPKHPEVMTSDTHIV